MSLAAIVSFSSALRRWLSSLSDNDLSKDNSFPQHIGDESRIRLLPAVPLRFRHDFQRYVAPGIGLDFDDGIVDSVDERLVPPVYQDQHVVVRPRAFVPARAGAKKNDPAE